MARHPHSACIATCTGRLLTGIINVNHRKVLPTCLLKMSTQITCAAALAAAVRSPDSAAAAALAAYSARAQL